MGVVLSSTPFGRRALSFAMVAGQVTANECPPDTTINKWQAFRTICEAKAAIGVTDRSLVVLNALLSFHPETDLCGGDDLIVFPSNAQLALRAHGMAPATLRRHLAVLVECGLLIRRDSPNGKRYARKGQGGSIEQAFGFDLIPLVARVAEFVRLANEIRAERRALQLCRERITLSRRDIAKMLSFGRDGGVAADWNRLQIEYQAIIGRLPRTATLLALEPCEEGLAALAVKLRKILETHVKSKKPSANESHFERHIHYSNPNPDEVESRQNTQAETITEPTAEPEIQITTNYPLNLVLKACPDIADYARNGISRWGDLIETANLVRSALGVTLDAWNHANQAMGPVDTAIITAAMLQRAGKISNPGGYLRSLTEKARNGNFTVGPALMALLRKQNGPSETAVA
ncbi:MULTISPECIES: plasmid replication protein RepC [unclassified Mesorhizobium]|uniref:plasmid replication protein RepC n=1 Tax=unclassified Mesorhizobium TaxID=325217 RepID=UPI003014A9C3